MSTNTVTVQAARLLLTRLGLSPEDLLREPAEVPTFAEYVPKVALAAGPGARRTYSTYWAQIVAAFGDRRLDQCDATDIEILMRHTMETRIVRRTDRGGHSTGEHLLAAMRTIYTHAIRDELLPLQHNPAAAIPKPSRQRSLRRALTNPELAAINDIAATTGNDTPLDTLILRLHTETACRRGGALALREDDVDPHWCLLRLREKNNTIRWQPASPTLIKALLHHRDQRGTGRPCGVPKHGSTGLNCGSRCRRFMLVDQAAKHSPTTYGSTAWLSGRVIRSWRSVVQRSVRSPVVVVGDVAVQD